jgi:ADP-heptose:LPS heptosyltransferase
MNTKPQKLLLVSHLSPGDTVMLTAAVRDLHIAYPFKYQTDVFTTAMEIWDNNPYITKLNWEKQIVKENDKTYVDVMPKDPEIKVMHCHYDLIKKIKDKPYHFIHGYAQDLEQRLNIRIPITKFRGDIHLTPEEKSWMSQVEEKPYKLQRNFWIIAAGGKKDFTCKWWSPVQYQRVVDHFMGKLKFVQVGQLHHWHPPLTGVIDLRGKTNMRQLIRLMYHAEGVLCPVTLHMHLAAAVPVKPNKPRDRACVVIAGGREDPQWEAYPTHQYIHNCGALPCCEIGGCWRSRCQLIGDGDKKDFENLCDRPIQVTQDVCIPECMHMITAEDVINRIETYYACEGSKRKYYE